MVSREEQGRVVAMATIRGRRVVLLIMDGWRGGRGMGSGSEWE